MCSISMQSVIVDMYSISAHDVTIHIPAIVLRA